jgi:hypothetical protein
MIYCPEIFHSVFIKSYGTNYIEFGPCCQSGTNTIQNEMFDFDNSTFLNKLREENHNNTKSSECNRCWEAEANNLKSKRESAVEFYEENNIDDVIKLHTLEYNTTWACNLGCIMCDPMYSSTLATELGVTTLFKQQSVESKSNQILNELDLSNIKRVHFNGGEPLINSVHLDVLKKIPTLSDCKVSYNTNGTKIPSDEVMHYWSKCKMVRIFFSIDAIGDAFNYIRWKADWDSVKKNMQWFVENAPSNVMFGINATVGVYNLLEIPEMYNWYKSEFSTNREGDRTDFNWQVAYNYDFANASHIIKTDALNELGKHNILPSLCHAVTERLNKEQNDDWIINLNNIDARRNTDWKAALRIGKYY